MPAPPTRCRRMRPAACALALLLAGAPLRAQVFEDASHRLPTAPTPPGEAFGASAVDVNLDQRVDLFRRGALYIQQADGTFENQTEQAGLAGADPGVFGAVFGDYDNDGFLDVFFEDLSPPSAFFRNTHNATFRPANADAALHVPALTQGSAWGDFNADGFLDLFVGSDDGANRLYLNTEFNVFADATAQAGIHLPGHSYGVATADYDRDGDLDVYIGACSSAPAGSINALLRNDGSPGSSPGQAPTFTNVASEAGVDDGGAAWGVVWLDVDNDGWLDLYVANMPIQAGIEAGRTGINKLYLNDRQGGFTDISEAAGVAGSPEDFSLSAAAADFDNDGWIDIYVGNRDAQNILYRNNGTPGPGQPPTFTAVTPSIPGADGGTVAAADVDADGWVDLFLPQESGDRLIRNVPASNHWLKVRARGKASNLYGVGARIEVYAGGRWQVREIGAGDGMTSQSHDLTAHFGLGTAPRADSLLVRWPGGHVDRLGGFEADREVTAVEGVGLNTPPTAFRLTLPDDGALLTTDLLCVDLAWETPTDDDALTYTVYITGEDVDLVFTDLTEPSLQLHEDRLPPGQTYTWSVTVTDGHSIRAGPAPRRFEWRKVQSIPPGSLSESLIRTYPNPFATSTSVEIAVLEPSHVTLKVYDTLGREVVTLLDQELPACTRAVAWDGRDGRGAPVGAGVYFGRLETAFYTRVATLVLSP